MSFLFFTFRPVDGASASRNTFEAVYHIPIPQVIWYHYYINKPIHHNLNILYSYHYFIHMIGCFNSRDRTRYNNNTNNTAIFTYTHKQTNRYDTLIVIHRQKLVQHESSKMQRIGFASVKTVNLFNVV